MKSTVENLSPTRVRLAVEVPFDDLKPSLDSAYKSLAQNMRVPGFRPGKVPARIIDQRVGRGTVVQEAVNEALPRFYGEAAREHELNVLGQPEITEITDAEEIVDGTDWHFTAEVDIRPEITLPELDGIAISVDDAEVTDEAVDEQLDELRDRFGTLTTLERAGGSGDYVSLDLSTVVDGTAIDEGSAAGLSYVIGSGDLIDGLDDAVTGKSAGESATFTTTLLHGDHAGSEAEVTAVVKSVKAKELPEIDDEFAQLASEFDTVDELKADLRERLARVRVMEQGAQARDHLIDHLIETVEFPLPESAVQAEIDYRQHDIVHSLNHDDALMERYLEEQGQTREEFDAEMRTNAEKSVRAQFILDAVAEKTEVQIGDSELTEYIVRQAQRYQMPPQEFANQIVQGGNLPMLVADIRRNKALAAILEESAVTDASGNTIDLSALTDDPDAELIEEAEVGDDFAAADPADSDSVGSDSVGSDSLGSDVDADAAESDAEESRS